MKQIIIILMVFFGVTAFSQNLVKNGSFEQTNVPCVYNNSGFRYLLVTDWYSKGNTPDLHNSCDTTNLWSLFPDFGTPKNKFGYQKPSTMNNYAGIYVSLYNSIINLKPVNHCNQEVLSTRLKYKLDSNVSYMFSMKVSVAGANVFFDGLGACLSSDSLIRMPSLTGKYYRSNIADISYKGQGFYTDTLNWVLFTGSFRADGTEEFLHIADLDSIKTLNDISYDSNNTQLYLPTTLAFFSYYYIDDVALWRADDSTYISSNIGQADTTICYGDSILLGSNDYDETYYRWEKITHGGQDIKSTAVFTNSVGWAEPQALPIFFQREQIYDSAFVWVKPTKTTTYILETTNCIFEKTYDTVVVTVQKCGPNAGMDTAVCKNSSLQLGDTDNIGYSCQWTPNTYLSSDTVPMPIMSATQSMLYYLTVTDNLGNIIKTDSVHIIAGDCYTSVEVIDDDTICRGDIIHLGKYTYSGAQYLWTPNWLLDNNTIANPYAIPDTTTLYTLQLTDIVGNISYDSVLITVDSCIVGIAEKPAKKKGFRVYPNPTTSKLNIELGSIPTTTMRIEILNLLGSAILTSRLETKTSQIDVSKLPQGSYLIRIIDDSGVLGVEKMIRL